MFLRKLTAALAIFIAASPATAWAPSIGSDVSNAELRLASGQSLSLRDFRGQVVVLTYWASDCAACDEQLRALDYYYRQRHDLGLRVLAVSLDDMDDRQLRQAFRDRLVHPVAQIDQPFEPLSGVPTNYVIDRYGQLRYAGAGALSIERLNELLVPLIRQPQP